jgi:uncharacterized protein
MMASSLAGMDPVCWDELAGGCFYSSSRWLEFCAQDDTGTVGAVWARMGSGARGTGEFAAVPVAEIRSESAAYYRWHDLLAGRGLPAPDPVGLLVGPRRGYQTHLLATPGLSREAAAAALLDLLSELRRQLAVGRHVAGGRPPPCVAMYLTTADVIALRGAGAKALPVLLDADAWIILPDGGWDGWLAELPKRRRWNIRHEVRIFAEAGFAVTDTTLPECYADLAPVWAPNQERYGHAADIETLTAKLRGQALAMGSAAKVMLCGRGSDRPVGFCLYYELADRVFVRTAGFEYERLAGAAEYFNVVFYEQIRRAASTGVKQIHAGIKSIEAKALRGAQVRPLWLLDLSDDSVLLGHKDAVRACNAVTYAQLVGSSPAVGSAVDPEEWLPFCSQSRLP